MKIFKNPWLWQKASNSVYAKASYLNEKLAFSPVKNLTALKKFYISIGWGEYVENECLEVTLTLENNSYKAVVGSGHFVATYKKEIFKEIVTYIGYKLGGDSETYLDEIILKFGLWRLTTYDNYAYHMGNVHEKWMDETLHSFEKKEISITSLTNKRNIKRESKIGFFIKNVLFIKFFNKRKYRRLFYKYKGMPKQNRWVGKNKIQSSRHNGRKSLSKTRIWVLYILPYPSCDDRRSATNSI